MLWWGCRPLELDQSSPQRSLRHRFSLAKRRDAARYVFKKQKRAIRQDDLNRTQRTFGTFDCSEN